MPGLGEYLELSKWVAMLNGARGLRPDLQDAIAAYSHFLYGEGASRKFSYERYVMSDRSGRITLRNAILEAQHAATKLWQENGKPSKFNFSGPAINCGTDDLKQRYIAKIFPYPATENWQKTIGAHYIWLSGSVTVTKSTKDTHFSMNFTLHAEDQYNFNKGEQDIATGISDAENGKLVVYGFADGYLHTSSLQRKLSWKGTELGMQSVSGKPIIRQKAPNRKIF